MTLPYRHRNHEIEELSERFFRNIIPFSWVVNSFKVDYGTDYNCEISLDNKVTGINFTIQLKGKETDKGKKQITIKGIKRSTINRWLKRLEPTMIVVYIVDEKEAYWTWFEEEAVDLTKPNKTFQIKISRKNKYSNIYWDSITGYLEEIFSRKHLLYEVPRIDKNKKAWELYFNNEFERALPYFKEISEHDRDGAIWNAIAMCQYGLFHYQDALIAINKAIEIDSSPMLLQNKSSILIEQGLFHNDKAKLNYAIQILEELIQQGAVTVDIYFNIANALKGLGEYEKAEVNFVKALKINPNFAQAWKNLGSIYFKFGLHEEELNCYNKALSIEPNLPEALFSKGVTLFKVFGEKEKGLKLMLRSAEISDRYNIDFPYAYFWIAEAYWELDKQIVAQEWNQKGLEISPTDQYLLNQKGRFKQ